MNNKFTLNWKILSLLLMMQKITHTQLQKNAKKMCINILIFAPFLSVNLAHKK